MYRLKWLVFTGALALLLGVVEAGPAAAAKGGNNETARACQQGGWQTLVAQNGKGFKNQGDCVNDGAQAGSSFGTAGMAACEAIPLARYQELVNPSYWTCAYSPNTNAAPPNDTYTQSLATACASDTNNASNAFFAGPGETHWGSWFSQCFAP